MAQRKLVKRVYDLDITDLFGSIDDAIATLQAEKDSFIALGGTNIQVIDVTENKQLVIEWYSPESAREFTHRVSHELLEEEKRSNN